jgi:hypothetical protein
MECAIIETNSGAYEKSQIHDTVHAQEPRVTGYKRVINSIINYNNNEETSFVTQFVSYDR